jgi:MacB-like periplasmic core domain/FtsX-like permease family
VVSFVQDLRYAFRMLLKGPGFATVAIVTLALGIGANVATFSVVYAVLLRPLPFPHPEQLVRVFDDLRGPNEQDVGMSAPELWDLQDRSGVFQDISALAPSNSAVGGGDRTVRAESMVTSPDYFTLLGAKPQIGRVHTQDDAVPGFLEPVVISDGFWRSNYGSDPKILGRKMQLDRDLYTIVGVMPAGFRHPGPTLDTDVEVWAATGFNASPFPVPAQRSLRMLPGAVGRLKPGLTVARAQAQLDAYTSQLSHGYPADYPAAAKWAVRLVEVKEDLVGPQRTELFILFGAVGFVLLIACVNIANLLLARASGRRREIAIRLAMGASRARLAGQLLTESTLLALISGVVAIVTVLFLKNAIISLAPADIPRLNEVDVSAGALFFAFVISMITGVLFGLAPALQAADPNQVENLREGGRGSGLGRRHTRLSRILVVSEIALSIVLLAGAGLLLRSFWHVLEVRPGYNPSHLTTAQIWIPIPNDPANDPYAQQIKFGFGAGLKGVIIVGVVGDIKSDGFDAPNVPHIYVPMGQFAPVNAVVFLRSTGDVERLGEAVRQQVEKVDPNVPVHSIRSMDQIIARSVADRRFALELLGVFAAVALLLAAVGIYGVMSYSFSQRTHEVGIRIALGAQRLDILRMALGEGLRIIAIGLASGLAVAAIVTRLFRSMLFGVEPADPITFLSVSAILAAVALAACYIPARRATRIDPLVALREE